ncbi:MAG: CBS domain-containing protein [Planctomycetota bacterium]
MSAVARSAYPLLGGGGFFLTCARVAFRGRLGDPKDDVMSQITARDFMVKKLVTLRPHMDVLEAVQMLLKSRISGAPVVDEEGYFLGVFSEKCAMHIILDAAYDQLPSNEVRAFMDIEAKTIAPETHLLTVAQVFLLTPYRRLPVLEDGKLVGQVSRRDVLQAAMKLVKHVPMREQESTLLYLSALIERHEAPLA